MAKPKRTSKAGKTQAALARRALKQKEKSPEPSRPDAGRTADEGMQSAPRKGNAVSGALDAEGHRPVLERSRKVR